ncbi:hypothetical protein [Vibrio ostreicida]|uniref:hypothetical protein n=1 Tax=Vibrio ostreicida TaxID=526588 RepID=UPI00387E8606
MDEPDSDNATYQPLGEDLQENPCQYANFSHSNCKRFGHTVRNGCSKRQVGFHWVDRLISCQHVDMKMWSGQASCRRI